VESTVSATIRDERGSLSLVMTAARTARMSDCSKSLGWPNIRVIVHAHNQGASAALLTGLYSATGDSVVVLNADLRYGPEHIDTLSTALWSQYVASAVASPYHHDGTVFNVPPTRLALTVLSSLATYHVRAFSSFRQSMARILVRPEKWEPMRLQIV
jgi:hypothetical protein